MTAHGLTGQELCNLFGQADGRGFNRALRRISASMWAAPANYRPEELRLIAAFAKTVGPLGAAPLPTDAVVAVLTAAMREDMPDASAAQRRHRARQLLDQVIRTRADALAATHPETRR